MKSEWRRTVSHSLLAAVVLATAAATAAASGPERSFERVFPASGAVTLDVLTRSGSVDVRAGSGASVKVRGIVRRSVSWRGAQVTDAQIASLVAAPPVRVDGATIRIEKLADDALWRATTIDYVVEVPADTRVVVETESGAVTVQGNRSDTRVETGSGAIRVRADGGATALRSGSGSVRARGTFASLKAKTHSGSIDVDGESIGAFEASTESGSLTASGIAGAAVAETGSGQITLEGGPAAEWGVRSRSGSVSVRFPGDSRFALSAKSRSGEVQTDFALTGAGERTKHALVGAANGGGPTVTVETGSSSVAIRSH